MSLPATSKDVRDNPGATGVTNPIDKEFKAKDIDRKMRFYGVIEAFRQGKYPSNAQIDSTLKYVNTVAPFEDRKLSADGKQLIQDVREIIDTARIMVKRNNEGELMQNFLYHTRHVDGEGHAQNLKGLANTGPSTQEAKNDGQQAAENLRTLAKLIYTSSETRKLLKDVSLLARDVAADAAIKAGEKVRPADHELNQVDEPAPHNEWIGPNGEKMSHQDGVPDTGLGAKKDQLMEKKEQAKQQGGSAYSQVRNEAQDAYDTGAPHAQEGADRMDQAQRSQPNGSSEQADATKQEAQALKDEKAGVAQDIAQDKTNKLKGAYGNAVGKIPEEHKERARQAKADTKQYFQDKFPEERRDRFIYRLKKVVVEQQRHRDFQDAIEFFLGMAETYHGHAKGALSSAGGKAGDVRSDPAFQEAELEMRTLLERFANGASMQPMFDAVNQIYVDSQNDPELRRWFHEVDQYVRRVLQEPGYVMKDSCNSDGNKVLEDGKRFWNVKYANHRETLFNEIENFFTSYADDPLNVQFGQNWKTLTTHLFLNSEGNITLKPHLWQDITSVILPDLIKHVGYVPIPRVEYSDPQIDLVIENLTLEGQNLLPNIIEVEMKNYFKLSAYDKIRNANKHDFTIAFSQIQADIRDVAFFVHKKTGFPKLKEHGIADVVLSGKGVSGKVHIESSSRSDSVFIVKEVNVKVDKLAFSIRESKHNILYSMVRPLASGLIKKAVQKAIEMGIRNALSQVDAQLVDIKERMEATEGDDNKSKMDAIMESFTQKKEAAKQTADQNKPKGTFQITGKRDSKIVDWSSPESIVEKQGYKADQVNAGASGWKSDAFTIV